jgi:hypothetical protein
LVDDSIQVIVWFFGSRRGSDLGWLHSSAEPNSTPRVLLADETPAALGNVLALGNLNVARILPNLHGKLEGNVAMLSKAKVLLACRKLAARLRLGFFLSISQEPEPPAVRGNAPNVSAIRGFIVFSLPWSIIVVAFILCLTPVIGREALN